MQNVRYYGTQNAGQLPQQQPFSSFYAIVAGYSL